MSSKTRVGLMGGSFDPIHLGHIAIAGEARDALQLSHVLFLPSGRPPHKAHLGASPAQRLEMTRLAGRAPSLGAGQRRGGVPPGHPLHRRHAADPLVAAPGGRVLLHHRRRYAPGSAPTGATRRRCARCAALSACTGRASRTRPSARPWRTCAAATAHRCIWFPPRGPISRLRRFAGASRAANPPRACCPARCGPTSTGRTYTVYEAFG